MKSSSLSTARLVWLLTILLVFGVVLVPVAKGQVNFSTPPTYAGGGTVFAADFNGDHKPVILAADGTLNLGNGDGTFTPGTPVAGGALAVADFNGDGKPDVLQQGTGTLLVLLGNGDGTFQQPISTNSGASLTLVAAADLNGDGKADVAGVSNGTSTLFIYLNNGDGTFAAGVPYNLGTVANSAAQITFGDFNGDHRIDVAVLTFGTPGQDVVLLGNGDGTFQSTPIISSGAANPASVTVDDFNGDGKLDLAIPEGGSVFLQLGNGDGTFQAPTTACTGPYSAFVFEEDGLATADLNGDGKLDLVFTADLIGIYLGNGDGTFSKTPSYYQPMFAGIPGVAIADFNRDGKPDVAADGEILLGNGMGMLHGPPTVSLASYAGVAVVGKFVKNGAPGVAAISTGNGSSRNTLYVLTNDGTGTLSLAHTYTLPQASYAIATVDVNADGNLDLIVVGADSSGDWGYSVFLGSGNGSFKSPVLYQQKGALANQPTMVIADFDNDHKLDVAISTGNQSVAVLLGNGDGTFGPPAYFFDGGADSIVSADFNADGKPDIAAAGLPGLAILLGNGDGTFQPAAFPYTTGLGSLLTADLNGDGKADLIGDNFGILVFLGNGDGTFSVLPPFGYNGFRGHSPIGLADVNGDGTLDVLTGDQFGSSTYNGIFLGNGDGTFDPSEILVPYNYPTRDAPPGAQAVDMNGDGKPDLVIESPVSTIFVLINSTVPVPAAAFLPASVAFPPQMVGTSSNPTPVTLTNAGAVTLIVKSVTLGGADAGEFKQTNNCTTIEPSQNCTINVTFAPTAGGGSSANLIVADNAGTGLQKVVVSGTGADFAISAATPSPASVTVGGSATTTVTVTSVGGFNQSVALACGSITLNGAAATMAPPTCKFSPSSVSSGSGTSTLTLSTTGRSAALAPVSTRSRGMFYSMLLPILGMALMGRGFGVGQKKRLGILLVGLMISGLAFLAACGGGSSGGGGTPAGTYTISISGSAGSTVNTTAITLTVQ
jgi:hypothetical protein